ncbi:MAG: response regulator transcription factor [Gammaproteobacteria bacterium]
MASVIRTLIVDDHPVVRYGVKHMLDVEPDIEVVGELEDIGGIDRVLADLHPDVVLLDLELKDTAGVDALRQLRKQAPGMRVIIYTSHDETDRIIDAAELGVDGYLLKGCPQPEIVGAIRRVHDGGTALESSVASKLMQHMSNRGSRDGAPAVELSKRERQVLELLCAGMTNRDISAKLCISESTVKYHVHAILDKLDAGNRTQAVSIAAQQGIVDLAVGG